MQFAAFIISSVSLVTFIEPYFGQYFKPLTNLYNLGFQIKFLKNHQGGTDNPG